MISQTAYQICRISHDRDQVRLCISLLAKKQSTCGLLTRRNILPTANGPSEGKLTPETSLDLEVSKKSHLMENRGRLHGVVCSKKTLFSKLYFQEDNIGFTFSHSLCFYGCKAYIIRLKINI